MLETLLESKSRTDRSIGGAMVSVTAHSALIAAAIYATANAGVRTTKLSDIVHPVYFPSPPKQVRDRVSTAPARSRSAASSRMIFVEPRLDLNLPQIDIGEVGARRSDFVSGAVETEPSSTRGGGQGSGDAPLNASQVEKQVALLPGNAPPRYPEALRRSGVEGQVVAIFVVDEQGRVEETSVRFARSDNPLFEQAVRAALAVMRFTPAEVGGARVRQLVQMPLLFTLAR